jgi:hypothetical protein
VYDGLHDGASGFLLKDTLIADLLSAIRVVVAGDSVVAPSATGRLIERLVEPGALPARVGAQRLAALSDREREVLALLARGLSNAEVDAWYSGRAHRHGGNAQAVMRPTGSRSGSARLIPARSTTSPPTPTAPPR